MYLKDIQACIDRNSTSIAMAAGKAADLFGPFPTTRQCRSRCAPVSTIAYCRCNCGSLA